VKTLKRLGHRVVPVSISQGQLVETILSHVVKERPDFLLSVNHLGFDEDGKLAQLLEAVKLPFAVWYVDSPTIIIKNFTENISPNCVLFLWDRSYIEPMKKYGFGKTHFLPLATDPSIFKPIRRNRIPQCFREQVSFVGNSMVEAVENWFSRLPRDSTTEAITRFAVPLQIANHPVPIKEILETIAKKHGLRPEFKDPVDHLNLQAALVWKATMEYRKTLVESLGPFAIRIYGDPGWHQILNGTIKISPPINYYTDLPMIFNGTDVNINATSFQMNSAVNQRVFDAASCGALLLTDHQPDMDTLFDLPREAVCYEEATQAQDQVAYYLKNEKDRRRIAERARRRVLAEHTYVHRLQRMISLMRDEFGSF
jgi:spore maturation protein CgeB